MVDDIAELLPYIEQLSQRELEDLYASIADFDEIPVHIDEFLESDKYLGGYFQGQVFPYWKEVLQEIYPSPFHSPYWLIALRGSIGQGKSTIACAGTVYDLYRLLCMKSPQVTYGLLPSTKILFAIFNTTMTLTQDVIWDKIAQMLAASPYFSRITNQILGRKKRGESMFPKNLDFFMGSRMGHTLGRAIFGCLTGDTKISLLDGTEVEIKDLVGREEFWVYSCKEDGEIVPGKGHSARITKKVDIIYEIELDDGSVIKCTDNHPFMKRNGEFVHAEDLKPGDSLMPMYFKEAPSRWKTYPAYIDNKTGKLTYTHRMVAKNILGGYKGKQVVHHKDFNSKNNNPSNLALMDSKEHKELHKDNTTKLNAKIWNDPNFIAKKSKELSELNKTRWKDPKFREKIRESQSVAGKKTWSNRVKNGSSIDRMSEIGKVPWKNKQFVAKKTEEARQEMIKRWNTPGNAEHLREFQSEAGKKGAMVTWSNPENHKKISETSSKTMTKVNNKNWSSPEWIEKHRKDFARGGRKASELAYSRPESAAKIKIGAAIGGALSANKIINWTCPQCDRFFIKQVSAGNHKRSCINHKVKSVRIVKLGTPIPVYDITVDEHHNFALTSGVFVHNSVLSEANFEVVENQMYDTFNSMLRRMESRFITPGGTVPGKIWVDSSETDKFSVVNKVVDSYKNKSGVFVSQASLWEVQPQRYGQKRFWVFQGSEVRPPEVLKDGNTLLDKEPQSCIEVPEEHRDAFDADINAALRDLAGVPVVASYKLFRLKDKLHKSFAISPLFPEIVVLDFDNDAEQLINYVIAPNYFGNPLNKHIPRHIHVDIGLTGDRLGIASTYVSNYRERKGRDTATFEETVESVPELICEWAFAVEPTPGKQVPLYKIRMFIAQIQRMGYPIGGVSYDGYQSADGIQQLQKMGIEAEVISVDRTTAPYFSFRSAIYEGRMLIPKHSILTAELEDLEVSSDGKKVDHPQKSSKGGKASKDVSDAVVGSYFGAEKNSHKHKIFLMGKFEDEKREHSGRGAASKLFWPNS